MFYLALKNVIGLTKKYKGMYGVCYIVLILVTLTLFYLYFFNEQLAKEETKNKEENRTYVVSRILDNETIYQQYEMLYKKFDSEDIEAVWLYSYNPIEYNEASITLSGTDTKELGHNIAFSRGEVRKSLEQGTVLLDNFFESKVMQFYKIGSCMKLQEVDFQITAIGKIFVRYETDAVINIADFRNLDLQVDEVEIIFSKELTKKEEDILCDIFKYHRVEFPKYDIPIQYTSSSFWSRLFLIYGVAILSILNIMAIYKFILVKREKEFLIHRICGISNMNLLKMMLWETGSMIVLCYTISCMIVFLVTKMFYIHMEITVFLQVFLIELLCVWVNLFYTYIKMWKKDIVFHYKREAE